MDCKIRFSNKYLKLPVSIVRHEEHNTYLVSVTVCDKRNLPSAFLEWDTEYLNDTGDSLEHYTLPEGKVIILLLFTVSPNNRDKLWTTIRLWNPSKEQYYRQFEGKEVSIEF